ncbi:hypothetical protein K7X08_033958 [Anisodus acutangulus]|uniref:F-box domain-containing protein n=1 Tax=Anisodus acutangulus TaxID=402998 RepID=A0A9Q1RLR8_9SOLA|nr:hypothetical protein K7X08_033958 [Anisodus acutangulus]
MTLPKGRNHHLSLPLDFLSNLPDNVINLILIHLPCKDAVRTSILSKKWKYIWCRLTEFALDEWHWKSPKGLIDPTFKFMKIINQLLTHHEGPITKFTLDIHSLESCPKIDNFIYFLSRNGVQHLVLRLPCWKPYKLPSLLFTCSQLRHLSLCGCLIHPPSAFKGFNKLISLELRLVTISSELLEKLIAHCPLLEQLVLVEMLEVLNIVEINAPMLRSFDFTGCISSICLKNVPFLAKVSLIGEGSSVEARNFDFAKFFESCSVLEDLLLDFLFSEFFAEGANEAPTRLPFDLNRVKRFYLRYIVLEESYKLSCALCLIRSFPHLEYLTIEIYNEEGNDRGIQDSLELERFSYVTFNNLKEVKLEDFMGTTPEMQLIKLFLAKSPMLVRVLINSRRFDEPLDTRLKVLAELSEFWHASPNVEVVYQSKG